MAQIQEHCDPRALYASPPQPQSRFAYGLDSFAPLCAHDSLTTEASMAQPLLSPFTPENRMQQPQWSMSQLSMSSSMTSMQNQPWEQLPVSDDWTGLPNEPLVMVETGESMLANNNLLYSHNALQNALDKPMAFSECSFWTSNGRKNYSGETAPSPGTDILLSPVSPFSEAKHTYSPGPDSSPVSSSRGPASYTMSRDVTKVSSPGFVPLTPQSVIRQQPGSAAVQNGFGYPTTSAGTFYRGNTVEQTDSMTMYGSEHAFEHSRSGSPATTAWYPPGYTGEKAAFVQGSQHQQSGTLPFDRHPNSFLAPLNRSSRQRQAQWSNKNAIPEQSHFQSRFLAPLADNEKAQRTKDDETLLQMKQDGYTYKDIRKALGRKIAESTLRGRYRSLTKPRNHRVRAPKWTEIDIVLLKRYVQEEFDKLGVTQPSLETKQKPDKIPWTKIVELIAATGGTYRFGAATAKKKWTEVTRSDLIRSSRRRNGT